MPNECVNIDDDTLVEIIKMIHEKELKTFSNNQLKRDFHMGYDVAERYMQCLEELGIISSQPPRSKRSRMVDLDRINDYFQIIKQMNETQDRSTSVSEEKIDNILSSIQTNYDTLKELQKESSRVKECIIALKKNQDQQIGVCINDEIYPIYSFDNVTPEKLKIFKEVIIELLEMKHVELAFKILAYDKYFDSLAHQSVEEVE